MMRKLLCLVALVTTVTGYCGKREDREIAVMATPPAVVEVEIGGTVSILCAAHGKNMNDPHVFWSKGHGPDLKSKGRPLPITATGKSVFYIEEVKKEDIDSYKCVIEDCCGDKLQFPFQLVVPDSTCKDVYGIGNVSFSATWTAKSWPDAVEDCRSKGLEIALPKSDTENLLMQQEILASFANHPNAIKFNKDFFLWIGAHDNNWDGIWRTSKGERILTYTNWMGKRPNNQPDDKAREESDTANVAAVHRVIGKWDDWFMHEERPFICRCPDEQ